MEEIHSSNLVMQFLMGLNDSYDYMIGNILLMEPLPTFNKVYSMFARIENQRNLSVITPKITDSSALADKVVGNLKPVSHVPSKPPAKKTDKKSDRFCNFCNKAGHVEDSCFKKNGYPEWFQDYKAKQGKKNYANHVDVDDYSEQVTKPKDIDPTALSELIQREVQRYMKGKALSNEAAPINTSYFADFAGTLFDSNINVRIKSVDWILDSGASSHVTGASHVFFELRKVKGPSVVHLPDGTTNQVMCIGDVVLSNSLVLKDVLYVPEFKYNLISVCKLASNTGYSFVFDSQKCLVQDL